MLSLEEKAARGIYNQTQVEMLRGIGNLARDNHIIACPRVPVSKCPARIPPWMYERNLEQNQQIASCCRHPENHDIAAYYSSPEDQTKGVPDVYVFFCTCGREHPVFMVGGSRDPVTKQHTHRRPFWEVR